MKTNDQLISQIQDLVDGKLSAVEAARLHALMEKQPELKTQYEMLMMLHDSLKQMPAFAPSSDFTAGVMRRLHGNPARSTTSIWKGLLLLAGMMIMIVVAGTLIQQGVFDSSTTIDLNNITSRDKLPDTLPGLPAINISGKLIMDIIIMLNLITGFVILDRMILRQIFKKRMTI